MQNKKTIVRHLGLIDYQQALEIQKEIFDKNVALKLENRKNGTQIPTTNYLLICEHPHVYTLGRSGDKNNLLINSAKLKEAQAQFFETSRGGDITYHGPGQLVVYPILDLDQFFTDIHKFLRFLEEAIILTLADYGVESGRIDGLTGVWIDHIEKVRPRKICAMGVKASRWVTMHGLAVNVNTDLSFFNHIVPCGITDKAVTSLNQELALEEVDLKEVSQRLIHHISNLFQMEII